MTALTFTTCVLPEDKSGRMPIHMYIGMTKPTWTDSPREERCALNDAKKILDEFFAIDPDDVAESLIQPGEPPETAIPCFVFGIGVSFDCKSKIPHYTKLDYKKVLSLKKLSDVYPMCMELREAIFTALREGERNSCKAKGVGKLRTDLITAKRMEEEFGKWLNIQLAIWHRRYTDKKKSDKLSRIAKRRPWCLHQHAGYCSPRLSFCPFCKNGKCVKTEVDS